MTRIRAFAGLLFCFFLLLILLQPPQAAAAEVTVLIYHRFGEDRYPSTNISIAAFREQLVYLRDNNFQVIPLAELVDRLKQGRALPEKGVVLTIDDGYKSVYHRAWPVLKEFGFPFTVFLYTRATENRHWDYMTWEQVRELQEQGVDFQDHGYGHHRMALPHKGMEQGQYRSWIREDMEKSLELLTRELGTRPRFFAAPYGEYNNTVLDLAEEVGYEALLTQDSGSVSDHTDPMQIPREAILGFEWASLDHFKTVLERVDLPVAEPTPEPVPLSDPAVKTFSARLLFPKRYLPGTVGIYVSELGWHQAEVTENGVAWIENHTLLTRRLNRVAISAREKESGRTAIRFWLLANPFAE